MKIQKRLALLGIMLMVFAMPVTAEEISPTFKKTIFYEGNIAESPYYGTISPNSGYFMKFDKEVISKYDPEAPIKIVLKNIPLPLGDNNNKEDLWIHSVNIDLPPEKVSWQTIEDYSSQAIVQGKYDPKSRTFVFEGYAGSLMDDIIFRTIGSSTYCVKLISVTIG